jgi:hypothetical protein
MADTAGFKESNKYCFCDVVEVVWEEYPLAGVRGNGLGRSGRGLRLRSLYEWSFDCVGWGGVKLGEWFNKGIGCE